MRVSMCRTNMAEVEKRTIIRPIQTKPAARRIPHIPTPAERALADVLKASKRMGHATGTMLEVLGIYRT